MFKEKYGINPKHLAIWSSIYLLTIIPAYQILFERVPYLFLVIVLIENMVCMYVFQDEVLEDLTEEIKGKTLVFFAMSMMLALILFLSLIFSNLDLFITVCTIELIGFLTIKIVQQIPKMRNK